MGKSGFINTGFYDYKSGWVLWERGQIKKLPRFVKTQPTGPCWSSWFSWIGRGKGHLPAMFAPPHGIDRQGSA